MSARVRKGICPGAALVALLLGLAPVSSAGAFSKAIWGDVFRSGVSQFPLYHKLGVSIYEGSINWANVAPTRPLHAGDPNDPAYAWPAEVDRALSEARKYHIRVLLPINTTPAWANGGHSNRDYAPRNPADFAAFAAAAARRWPSVRLWMVWGEPIRTFLPIVPADTEPGSAPHRRPLRIGTPPSSTRRTARSRQLAVRTS